MRVIAIKLARCL